jgi:hypothetical protein
MYPVGKMSEKEKHLLVGERIVLDLERAHIRMRDAQILCLAAGICPVRWQ